MAAGEHGLSLLWLLLSASAGFQGQLSNDSEPWQWAWQWSCEAGRCVRSASPLGTPQLGSSLQVCRLACGKYGSLWPLPTGATVLGSRLIPVDPKSIDFEISEASRSFLEAATEVFVDNLERECGGACSRSPQTNVSVRISTTSPDLSLTWDTDESYVLEIVTRDGEQVLVELRAATVFGARHGLESLSQLTAAAHPVNKSGPATLVMVAEARVTDAPVYPHRGLLIDTSRNFIPLPALKRQVDGLAASKMNVLHWHATDSHSFPLLVSGRARQLAQHGAYSAAQVYTAAEVRHLAEYARARGVRLLLEIDAPAHAASGWQWGPEEGLGHLAVCVGQQPWRAWCIQPPCGQLNPANPNMYAVLRDLYRELANVVTPAEGFHMGGDEVFFPCWNATPEVVSWMSSNGRGTTTKDFLDVWAEFQRTALGIWDEEVGHPNTPIMLWSSHLTDPQVIENYLDKDRYVIQTWVKMADRLPADLLKKGYRVVVSSKDTWYLDHGFWGSTRYHSWRAAYDTQLPHERGVLGGEAAMWSELVDELNLEPRVWPRSAAVGERLWADPPAPASGGGGGGGSQAALTRFLDHRERLVRRGLRPAVVTPAWCYQHDGEC